MSSVSWRRATSSVLVVSLSLFLVGPLAAEPATVFSGKVLGAGGTSPREGVIVRLVGETPETSYATQPTGDDGAFRLEGARPGSYRVVAEAAEGAYLAADGFELAAGANRPLALTLAQASPNFQTGSTTTGSSASGGLPTWAKWTIVGGIALVALWAIDSVTEDEDETSASPM